MISKFFPRVFIQFFLKQHVKKSNVLFGRGSIINKKSYFEGYNKIGNNTQFTNSSIGLGTYIANNSIIKFTKIGRFCAIGDNVRTFLGRHPSKEFVSIHPAFFSILKQSGFTFVDNQLFDEHVYLKNAEQYVCVIGNDVWIGNNVLIMDGITVGDGAIIAAGAIVTKNVEPYTIVGGVPAKLIKKRFADYQIERLLKIEWWNWNFHNIKKLSATFRSVNEFILNSDLHLLNNDKKME